jgi:hypothetical protein
MNIDDCSPYHTTLNRLVAGSIPAASTIYINHLQQESGDSQKTESCLVTVLMAVVPICCCSNLLLFQSIAVGQILSLRCTLASYCREESPHDP